MPLHAFAKIGPKFLEHIGGHVESDLRARSFAYVAEAAITVRVIGVIGDGCSGECAAEFGVVDLSASRICARDENAADGVSGTMQETSMAGLEIAWVLVKERRQDGTDHEVFDGGIAVRSSVAFCVACKALAVRRIAVAGLADECNEAHQNKFRGIKYALRDDLELLSRGERWDFVRLLQREEVGKCKKETILGGAVLGVIRLLGLRRVRGRCLLLSRVWLLRSVWLLVGSGGLGLRCRGTLSPGGLRVLS